MAILLKNSKNMVPTSRHVGICSHAPAQSMNLKTHIVVVHEKKKSIMCELCNTNFAQKDSLKNHLRSVHIAVA